MYSIFFSRVLDFCYNLCGLVDIEVVLSVCVYSMCVCVTCTVGHLGQPLDVRRMCTHLCPPGWSVETDLSDVPD